MSIFRNSIFISTAVLLAACSSTPKPHTPDGSNRVNANDPSRVQALQDRVAQDRVLLTENNLLKAQVEVLNLKLNEMVTIVREALVLPPPAPVKQVAPSAVNEPQATPIKSSGIPVIDLPSNAYKVTSSGVVIRVFHPFAKTDFEPSEGTAQALRETTRSARTIEVRGMTDSPVVNSIDRLIAIERAEKARNWLIQNGVDSAKIRTKYFSAGNFISDNKTEQGRALNRRVEVDVRNI
jgi:outer membrane protein OmpA-like peptidoglycan-associated protein